MRKDLLRQLYRIIDANGNRAIEGLRVCEDLCRFVYNARALTKSLKDLRHHLVDSLSEIDILKRLNARAANQDVGQPSSHEELPRQTIEDIFYANAQRVKESLRVLEECLKPIDRSLSEKIKGLRYQFYSLEQRAVKCLDRSKRK